MTDKGKTDSRITRVPTPELNVLGFTELQLGIMRTIAQKVNQEDKQLTTYLNQVALALPELQAEVEVARNAYTERGTTMLADMALLQKAHRIILVWVLLKQ